MARKARGQDVLEVAKAQLSKAKTADALRQAQAVVFPLAYGMSLERTAEAIGVSAGWASQLRNRFIINPANRHMNFVTRHRRPCDA